MAPDQADAVLYEEAENPGEVSAPALDIADDMFAEFDRESLDIDELIGISDAVGSMAESLANAPEGETITEATATALGIAVEHFCKRANVPNRQVFALEQFAGGYATRQHARKMALEGMTDVIKKITAKIIAFIRKIMTYLYDTMQELVFGADNILNAARTVQEQARQIAHRNQSSDTVDDQRLVSFFTKDEKTYTADDALHAYKDHCDAMKKSFSAGYLKEVGLRVHETLVEASKRESEEATVAKVDQLVGGMLTRSFHDFTKVEKSSSHEIQELALPFGQRRLVLLLSMNDDGHSYSGFSLSMDEVMNKPNPATERKLEAMNYGQIIRVAKEIENQMLFGLFKSYKGSKADLQRIKNTIEKGCEQIANQQQGTARNSTAVGYSVNFLKDLASSLVNATVITHRYDILMAQRLLEYCQRSIKAHA